MRVALAPAVCMICVLGPFGAAALGNEPAVPRVRGIDRSSGALIAAGQWRSETFQRLISDLEQSDLVVYVGEACLEPGRAGALRFVGEGVGVRFLLVELNDVHADDLTGPSVRAARIATLAHELQDALEVAGTGSIRDAGSFDAYYRQHGLDAGDNAVDTEAARVAGVQVHFEMTGRRGP